MLPLVVIQRVVRSLMCKKNNVLFTNTECLVLSPEFKLPDENQVLLRVPKESNMYNVDLKYIVPSGDLTCLFAKATLNEFNLWHRRLGHINFKPMNKLVKGNLVRGLPTKVFENNHTCVACKKGKQHRACCKTKPVSSASQPLQRVLVTKLQNKAPYEVLLGRTPSIGFMRPFGCLVTILNTLDPLGKFDGKADEEFLVGYSNTDDDAAFGGKEPESEVYVSLSSSAQTKKHDDKTKREAKGKSHVESSTGYRNLSVEFEDFFDDNINEVNAADSLVLDVGQISTNITDTFSTAGPLNTDVSPIHGKSSYLNTSQYPYDLNMPELEDITYSDDEEDIGAEADFTNLETTITEEGIDYEEVFAPVARIEAIGLFLAYASFMGFMVYQMDVNSAFLYGTIEEEIYVCQPPGFEDPYYPDKVYKVVKALYGLHQAPRAWYETLANYLLENGFQRGKIDQTLFIKRQKDRKSVGTPIHTEKPLLKDPDGEDVDVHTYRSMIDSLMYLTSSRPNIMFAVCACARFQVTPKALHLHAVKRIFRYLKGKLHLGLWYPKDSPFNLVAYLDSDYACESLDKKSTTGGCQFLGCRLISWQCKKQTVVATLSTEADPDQMVSGKDSSNPLMADNFPKIVWYSTHYVALMKSWLDQKQTALESIDCLPTEEIFTKLSMMRYKKPSTKLTFYKAFFSSQWKFIIYTILQCMSAKRTSWNEFSFSMASAVICLSTGRKFNFSKAQVGDLSLHSIKYSSHVLTQKVFSNMRRVGKGFSGVDTPLFEGMIAAQQDDDVVAEGAASVVVNDVLAIEEPSIPSLTPTT
nr:putative reverse transcriptase, RNA-dependent DNA polymerase [Tanacetum cinerariifolium]